ncbi:MAG: arylesterase [Pseudomonadota bacterium]
MFRILASLLLCLCASLAAAADKLLVFGDSLSAGYGIAIEQSWPNLLAERLRQEKFPLTVVNASISGETTAGGRSRLPAAIRQHQPRIVILALGANDGLRGLPPQAMRANLDAMIVAAQSAGAHVLLAGMQLPPNYGPDYTQRFGAVFRDLAQQRKTALLPFLLEPIALDDAAFQPDRLHPTAAAQPMIRDHVWAALKPLLKR